MSHILLRLMSIVMLSVLLLFLDEKGLGAVCEGTDWFGLDTLLFLRFRLVLLGFIEQDLISDSFL